MLTVGSVNYATLLERGSVVGTPRSHIHTNRVGRVGLTKDNKPRAGNCAGYTGTHEATTFLVTLSLSPCVSIAPRVGARSPQGSHRVRTLSPLLHSL